MVGERGGGMSPPVGGSDVEVREPTGALSRPVERKPAAYLVLVSPREKQRIKRREQQIW